MFIAEEDQEEQEAPVIKISRKEKYKSISMGSKENRNCS